MREIGVRALKASLSEALRAVQHGEPIRVTSRGKAIADIVPVAGTVDPWQRLADEGRITPAARPRSVDEPIPVKATRSASDIVVAERDAER